jgi:hypothetical protein
LVVFGPVLMGFDPLEQVKRVAVGELPVERCGDGVVAVCLPRISSAQVGVAIRFGGSRMSWLLSRRSLAAA